MSVRVFIYKLVNRRSDTDLGNTTSAPRGGETVTVCAIGHHGRRGWNQGRRVLGRDAHGKGGLTPQRESPHYSQKERSEFLV